jgi:hypothetical protein
MLLDRPFIKLPKSFDADSLAAEVNALPGSAWTPHPSGFVGNEAVRLVTPSGAPTDALDGPMAPTQHLLGCPYMMQLMAELGGVWGRSRLMGLAAGAEVPAHIDSHYYWRTHLRIHIPVITNPAVVFTCGDQSVHMTAGEAWVFDSFLKHDVQNGGSERRIHLVLDTVATERMWDLIEAGKRGEPARSVMPERRNAPQLAFEQINTSKIMSPWEMQCHLSFLKEHVLPSSQLEPVLARLERFVSAWIGTWAQYGDSAGAAPVYVNLVAAVRRDLNQLRGGTILLSNGKTLYLFLERLVFTYAVFNPALEQDNPPADPPPRSAQPVHS